MGCSRLLGLGEQHVQDKSSQKFCYILSSGVARILVRGAFNLILFKKFWIFLKINMKFAKIIKYFEQNWKKFWKNIKILKKFKK